MKLMFACVVIWLVLKEGGLEGLIGWCNTHWALGITQFSLAARFTRNKKEEGLRRVFYGVRETLFTQALK